MPSTAPASNTGDKHNDKSPKQQWFDTNDLIIGRESKVTK